MAETSLLGEATQTAQGHVSIPIDQVAIHAELAQIRSNITCLTVCTLFASIPMVLSIVWIILVLLIVTILGKW